MALIFSGFALIPRCDTRKPSRGTPAEDALLQVSLTRFARRLRNVSSMSWRSVSAFAGLDDVGRPRIRCVHPEQLRVHWIV